MFFGSSQKPWSLQDIPDQTAKVAIVTGGNSGLGFITCLELARHHAKVYMASRNKLKAQDAIQKIKNQIHYAQVDYLELDLTNLASCKKAAHEFLKLENRLDILINNAGVMSTPYKLSQDGIEIQACNGLGHFAFTIPLLPILEKTDSISGSQVRIVNLSSIAHRLAFKPDFSSLNGLNQTCLTTWGRYANSKLTNILFNNQLQKKLNHTNIHCLAVHPGIVDTGLFKGTCQSYPFLKPIFNCQSLIGTIFSSPQDGAINQLYAATAPEVTQNNLKGAYIVPYAKVETPSTLAQDPHGKLAAQFWTLCEQLVAEKS
ncbi:hypothetical protein O181_054643 [Austropuccinia psidii MF-1]|uniref:Uncharacterized protein n=1 Tax=Austropuccinia psidii MF-1 TaxID=1389203 RepID=A0A9Q3HRM2_9BASI|nr:hypothetical protein [Austropuccinia psidii MF-1]